LAALLICILEVIILTEVFSWSYSVPPSEFQESIVAYLLKARSVKPEKQPLLVNGSETTIGNGRETGNKTTFVARQHILNRQE
jgi:hypothetical protein